jgi:hypothetical protein
MQRMGARIAALVASAVLAAGVSACGGEGDIVPPPVADTGISLDPTPAQPCPERNVLVEFSSGDGWTFTREARICRQGRVTFGFSDAVSSKYGEGSFVLPDAQIGELTAALEAADFPELESAYRPHTAGADLPAYRLSSDGHEVTTDEFAIEEGRVPARLVHAIRMIDDLIREPVQQAVDHAPKRPWPPNGCCGF